MTPYHAIGQLFLVGFQGLVAPDYILEWLEMGKVGGIILFSRNVSTPSQLADLTASLHRASRFPIFISIDQEGGTVARLREHFSESPSALALSNTNEPELAEQAYHILGREMRQLGINWNYAPVVDITYNRENPTVGTRSFGTTAHRVAEFARYAVRGLQRAGVIACAKHFPGLGNTAIDTHLHLPTLDVSTEHILAHDLVPYRALVQEGVASVMTTHTRFTKLDDTYPATLSPFIVNRLLRQELGYDGYVTTDCMEMKAISDNYGSESAVLAVLGGIDSVLVSHTKEAQERAFQAVTEAVESGRISQELLAETQRRRTRLLAQYGVTHTPHATQLRQPQDIVTLNAIARQGVSLVKNAGGLPVALNHSEVLFVEFVSIADSEVMEQGGHSSLKRLLDEKGYSPRYMALMPTSDEPIKRILQALNLPEGAKDPQELFTLEAVLEAAKQAPITVIATRNAHIIPAQAERARAIAGVAKQIVHLCLRNPYDDTLLNAPTVLCAFGDSEPSLNAILDALTGNYVPLVGYRYEGV